MNVRLAVMKVPNSRTTDREHMRPPNRLAPVRLTANHETVEVKVAPIECDLEQVVQGGDAGVAVGAPRQAG